MKPKNLIIGSLIFHCLITFAQPSQTIKGIVIDKDSEMPLIGANVLVLNPGPPFGGSTDNLGHFRVENVPLGRHTIKVSYIGYEDIVIPQVLVGSGKQVFLTIEFREWVLGLDEIVVTSEQAKSKPLNDMAMVSARSFTVDEAGRYPKSFLDPSRMAQSYAGVTSSTDFTNEIVVAHIRKATQDIKKCVV